MDTIKQKLNIVLNNLHKLVDKFELFMELYDTCKSDDLLSDVSEIEFFSSFSDLRCANTSLSFSVILDDKQFTTNPYLSEFSGQITFTLFDYGITADLDLQLSEQFSNLEDAYKIYKKYDYLEYEDHYKRTLNNTEAGRFELTGTIHFNFSRMEVIKIEHMVKLSKATFQEMYKYLSNLEWIESLA